MNNASPVTANHRPSPVAGAGTYSDIVRLLRHEPSTAREVADRLGILPVLASVWIAHLSRSGEVHRCGYVVAKGRESTLWAA